MVFVPRFSEATEPQILDNLMSVIDRDFKEALDLFYEDDDLPAFAVMTDGEPSVFQYPLLVLGVQRLVSTETEQIDEGDYMDQPLSVGAAYLDQVMTIGAGLVVQDAVSLKSVRSQAKKYIRAMKSVIRSASASDLLPDTARVLNHSVDIDHRYLRHTTNGTMFLQSVEFEIKMRFGES